MIEKKPKPSMVKIVSVDKLKIDGTYQRSHANRKSTRIAEQWDDKAAHVLIVSERSNGDLYVVDGQHRAESAKMLGKKWVEAKVYEGLSIEDEADLFVRLNSGSTRSEVSAFYRFRAEFVAGRQRAVDILRILDENQMQLVRCGRCKTFATAAVCALEFVYDKFGPEILDQTLQIIHNAWGGLEDGIRGEFIGGLSMLLSECGSKINYQRFNDKLKSRGQSALYSDMCHLKAVSHSGKYSLAADVLLSCYNRGAKESARIDVRFS